jgi:hypothetical protein
VKLYFIRLDRRVPVVAVETATRGCEEDNVVAVRLGLAERPRDAVGCRFGAVGGQDGVEISGIRVASACLEQEFGNVEVVLEWREIPSPVFGCHGVSERVFCTDFAHVVMFAWISLSEGCEKGSGGKKAIHS